MVQEWVIWFVMDFLGPLGALGLVFLATILAE